MISQPVFHLIEQLTVQNRELDLTYREQVKVVFQNVEDKLLNLAYSSADISLIKYPLVAYVDENVSTIENPLRCEWMRQPLQLLWFGERTAGEGFFRRLDIVRLSSHKEIIEIYYLCLKMGFKGKFRVENQKQRVELIMELQKQLGILHPKTKITFLKNESGPVESCINKIDESHRRFKLAVMAIPMVVYILARMIIQLSINGVG